MKNLPEITTKIFETLLVAYIAVFSNDLIIDKQGNEFHCTIIKTENDTVFYRSDSIQVDSVLTFPKKNIFMLKYADGRKDVCKITTEQVTQSLLVSSRKASVAIQGMFGTFGLFNVDNVFTKADYTLGIIPYLDYRLTKVFSIGTECMFLFGKPSTKDDSRFIVNPNVRGKASFVVHPQFTIEAIIAAGVSIWPKSEGVAYIDSTFLDSRIGWDARATLGGEYIINPRWSLVLDIGYIANSTVSRNVWITHDMMLVCFGPKIRF